MEKKLIFAVCAGAFLFTTACSSDDDSSSPSNTTVEEVVNTVTSGTWRITSYIDSGNNETADFTGYNFTFGSTSLLTATNGTNTYEGTWSVTDDNDDSPSDDIDFNILFSAPTAFVELSDDWDVVERTSTKIRLVDDSGGNGGTDYLTFEKNP